MTLVSMLVTLEHILSRILSISERAQLTTTMRPTNRVSDGRGECGLGIAGHKIQVC
jgi:hypothetical protein